MLEVEILKISKGPLVVWLESQLTYYMRPLRPFTSSALSLFLIGNFDKGLKCVCIV
jgi:hypothetical protein